MVIASPKYESLYTIPLGKYKFIIRPEEKSGLNKRLLENPELKKSVLKKKVNDELYASLEYAVTHGSNSVVQIFGIPESGKSTILKIIIYELYQVLQKNDNVTIVRMTYNYMETIHEIYDFAKSHYVDDVFVKSDKILIIFQDEQTVLQGNESRSYETQLNNLLENFRAAQVFVFLASPNLRKIAVCNTYIEAIAKDMNKRVNWGLWMVPKRTSNKTNYEVHGSLLLEYTAKMEDFFTNYDQKKMDHIFKLMENRGLQTVKIPDEVLEKSINQVLKEAKKRKLKTKEQIKALANILGVGTSNTTKAVAELAGLQFEAMMMAEKEAAQAEAERQKMLDQKEEEKRISKLVVQVAKHLYEKFDFKELSAASRIVTGWIIENYSEDWQHLVKHKKYFWSLAEYWQFSTVPKIAEKKEVSDKIFTSSDRELLREAFYDAVFMRYKDEKLSTRASYYFIQDELNPSEKWSKSRQAREQGIRASTLNVYWKKHEQKLFDIKNNSKIWGDAGELYFKYKLLKTVKNGKTELWLSPELAIDLICAAEERSHISSENGSNESLPGSSTSKSKSSTKSPTTDLYDIEVLVDGVSAAAVNVKFAHLDNQSFKMSPEDQHENPWLFVIDKNTYNEFLIASKKGKTYISGVGGDRSQSMKEFLLGCIDIIS